MLEVIFIVEEAPKGGFLARALGYSIYTEADTWDELKPAFLDAVTCHFDDSQRSKMVRMHQVGDEVFAV